MTLGSGSSRILVVHNAYIHYGGEDACVSHEVEALKETPWEVYDWIVRSSSGADTFWNAAAAPFGAAETRRAADEIRRLRPDIVHFHNLFPLLSPLLFRSAKDAGARTVLTLHNYRPLCLNGLFLTPAGEVCERCAGGNFFPGILRGCYRDSRPQSLAMAGHLSSALRRSLYKDVDRFIAPSHFLKQKFIQAGFPDNKIEVQGHFLPEFPADLQDAPQDYVLYLGRLSEEKGVLDLLRFFEANPGNARLEIAGSGPLEALVRSKIGSSIHYSGFVSGEEKARLIRRAAALVMPSTCYENFPVAVMEANAAATPVLASNRGGLIDLVIPGENGERFEPGDSKSFWDGLTRLQNAGRPEDLRRRARRHAEKSFSKEHFLKSRLELYNRTLAL